MSFSCLTFSASASPRPLRPIRIQKRATSGLPCLQSTQAEEAGVHRLPSLLPGLCCFSTSTTPPASLPCGFRLFLSLFPLMLSGALLITCVTPSCPFCGYILPFFPRSLLLHCVLEHLVELVMQEKHRLNLNALPSSSQ